MNKLIKITLLLLILLLLGACRKDKKTPAITLPPYTEVGANTFGCMIDGKVFVPKSDHWMINKIKAGYQNLFLGNGEIGFVLSALNTDWGNNIVFNGVFNEARPMEEKTYPLGYYNGSYHKNPVIIEDSIYVRYYTEEGLDADAYVCKPPNYVGELTIKHFDLEKQIMSGTFWFDAVDTFGNVVEVRDGRFDVVFVR